VLVLVSPDGEVLVVSGLVVIYFAGDYQIFSYMNTQNENHFSIPLAYQSFLPKSPICFSLRTQGQIHCAYCRQWSNP